MSNKLGWKSNFSGTVYEFALCLNKLNATTAPGTGNDSSQGYSSGSLWVDETNDKAYVCVDASVGAAVWKEIGAAGGSGTVTSVALSLPAIFTVSGSPVTTSGTLTGSLATQTANFVWSGPTTGAAAAPTFRALVAADIPSLDTAKITTGTFAKSFISSTGTWSVAEIPNLPASIITSGTFAKSFISSTGTWAASEIPSLDASKITTGQLAVAQGGSAADLSATSGYLKQATSGSAFSNVATIPYTDVANLTTSRLVGRTTAGTGALEAITVGTGLSLSAGSLTCTVTGGGTVTSVGLSMPSDFSVIPGTITTSGTFSVSWNSVSINTFLCGPATGLGLPPTFRVLATQDFPTNVVAFSSIAQGSARSVLGVTGNATANLASIQGTANQVLVINSAGTALAFGQVNLGSSSAVTGVLLAANHPALTGDVTCSVSTVATTIANNAVTNAKFRQGVARSVVGVTGNATANVADIQGTADQVLVINSAGTALAFGQVNLASTNAVTGLLPITNLGTVPQSTKSANFTTATTPTLYLIDLSSATITATMGSAVTAGAGCEMYFIVTTAGTGANAGNNFGPSGISNCGYLMMPFDSLTLVSDGTNWQVKSMIRQPPSCSVSNSTTTSLTTATITKLTFDTEAFDAFGMHSTSVNTGRITIVRPGKYLVNAMIAFATNGTGQRRIYLYLNGSATRFASTPSSSSVTDQAVPYTQTLDLVNGDYLEIGGYQNSGGNLNVQVANTFLEATLVG